MNPVNAPGPGGQNLGVTDFPRTWAVLAAGREEGWHPGGQIYVSRGGQPLLDAAFGEARAGVPMTTASLNLWLSAGKPLVAVALAGLRGAGELDWDDPVVRFLPAFGAGGKGGVRLRHLLTHTGGFRGGDLVDPEKPWDELIAAVCAQPLESGWVPGERAGYHLSASWYVLGEIIQRITGRTFADHVREAVLLPRGMVDTWPGIPEDRARDYGDRVAVMHNTLRRTFEPIAEWASPAGAARCRPGSNWRGPIRDLGRFYESLLADRLGQGTSPGRLSPGGVDELIRRHRAGAVDETFRHIIDFGLGFVLNSNQYFSDGHQASYGYGSGVSADTFGHSGSQCSVGFADAASGLVVAWVLNGRPGEPRHQQRVRAIHEALHAELRP